jgi:hypothetical protein
MLQSASLPHVEPLKGTYYHTVFKGDGYQVLLYCRSLFTPDDDDNAQILLTL